MSQQATCSRRAVAATSTEAWKTPASAPCPAAAASLAGLERPAAASERFGIFSQSERCQSDHPGLSSRAVATLMSWRCCSQPLSAASHPFGTAPSPVIEWRGARLQLQPRFNRRIDWGPTTAPEDGWSSYSLLLCCELRGTSGISPASSSAAQPS